MSEILDKLMPKADKADAEAGDNIVEQKKLDKSQAEVTKSTSRKNAKESAQPSNQVEATEPREETTPGIPSQPPLVPPGTSNQSTSAIKAQMNENYLNGIFDAVYRSQKLINHASETGHEIEAEISKTITEFSHAVFKGDNDWTAQQEADFRNACSKLTSKLSPVTCDTLLSSTVHAKDYAKWFGGFTLFFLLVLAYSQFLWVLLSDATVTIDARKKDIQEVELQNRNLDYFSHTLTAELITLKEELASTANKMSPETKEQKQGKMKEINQKIESNEIEFFKNINKKNEAEKQLKASTKILVGWLPFQGWLKTSRPSEPGIFDGAEEEKQKRAAIKEWEQTQDEESTFRDMALHTWAKQILQGMSAYFLPLIYGLVGACAYVLRAMSRQMRELTFSTSGSTLQFMLRLVLGALAGIAIGWFLKPDPAAGDMISTLSPLALAFIAGYSVEMVFTAMDKIIVAFTGRGPGEAKETNNKPANATI